MDKETKKVLINRLNKVGKNLDNGKYTDFDLAIETLDLLGKLEAILHEFLKAYSPKNNLVHVDSDNLVHVDFDNLCVNYSKLVNKYIILKSIPKSATDDLKKKYIPSPIKHIFGFFTNYLTTKIAYIVETSNLKQSSKDKYMLNLCLACTDISYPKIFTYVDTITNYLKLNTHTKK